MSTKGLGIEQEIRQRVEKLHYVYDKQQTVWIKQCNLCQSTYFVRITEHDRYGYFAGTSVCANCGLAFLNPRLTADAYQTFYTNVYRPLVSAYHGRKINSLTIQDEQLDYARNRAEFVAPYLEVGTGLNLLDVGGSTGIVAHHFSERFGYSGTVLDPSPDELKEAKKLGLETVQGFAEEVDFGSEKFDMVLLCQTVDHLLDIRSALRAIRNSLTSTGMLLVDIVDFRAAYLRNWSVEKATKIDHPYSLTEESIEAYLSQAGYSITHKGFAADHLHINYLCSPSQPQDDYLPSPQVVKNLLREIRLVQNASRSSEQLL